MNLDELRPILHAYRQQVEPAWSPATAHSDYQGMAGNPAGQCGATSAWLQQRLSEDHAIKTTYCVGPVFTSQGCADAHHCWLEMDGDRVVIDLTADQLRGLEQHSVICETYDELVLQKWTYYEARKRLQAPQVCGDPVRSRLALLEAAVKV